jgi:hypothetical protein
VIAAAELRPTVSYSPQLPEFARATNGCICFLLRRSGKRHDGSKLLRWFYGINIRRVMWDRVEYITRNHAILAQDVANAMIVDSAVHMRRANFDMGSTLAPLQCRTLCVPGLCPQISELRSQMICFESGSENCFSPLNLTSRPEFLFSAPSPRCDFQPTCLLP